jgi:hypothetical protein
VLAEGYMYWVSDPTVLNQHGNTRIQFINGQMLVEVYDRGWMAI